MSNDNYQYYGSGDNYATGGYGRSRNYGKISQAQIIAKKAQAMLKNVMGSWLVLLLAVVSTGALVFNLIDMFPHFLVPSILIGIDVVKVLLQSLMCAGLWLIYSDGRKNDPNGINTRGIQMVRGVVTFEMVLLILIAAAVGIFFIVSMVGLGALVGAASTIMIVGVVLAFVIFAMLIAFTVAVGKATKSAKFIQNKQKVEKTSFYFPAVMLLLAGTAQTVLIVISIFFSSLLGGLIGGMTGGMTEGGGFMAPVLSGLTAFSWTSHALQICDLIYFVFGGVLLIVYSKRLSAIYNN